MTRVIVAEVSPEELPMCDFLIDGYFESDGRAPAVLLPEDREAGSGVETYTLLLTVFVIPIVQAALGAIGSGIREAVSDLTRDKLKDLLKPHVDHLVAVLKAHTRILPENVREDPKNARKIANVERFLHGGA
jgi:hypothetical protein